MKEKGVTPTGLSEEGYQQALHNYAYQIEQLARQLENMPGHVLENLFSFLSRGPVFDQLSEQVEQLDTIIEVIAETYGYDEAKVDRDVQEYINVSIERLAMDMLSKPEE